MFEEARMREAAAPEQLRSLRRLGLIIRSLVGLDREAARAAFSDFISGHRLSEN